MPCQGSLLLLVVREAEMVKPEKLVSKLRRARTTSSYDLPTAASTVPGRQKTFLMNKNHV